MAIKLDDHIVEIEGIRYIPYEVAVKAISEIGEDQINRADELLNKLASDLNLTFKNIDKND